ncbi:hypothetical protein ACFW04_001911 [Cataglyphis niger]
MCAHTNVYVVASSHRSCVAHRRGLGNKIIERIIHHFFYIMDEEEHEENVEKILEDENIQTNDTEQEYDDDFFEMEQSFEEEEEEKEEEEEESYEGRDSEEVEKKVSFQDWEKEAKRKIRIEMEDPTEKRRTLYDIAAAVPSMTDIWKFDTTQIAEEPQKKIRYSISMEMPGIVRIDLSPLTQKIVGCVIGENVTTEYPWVYVRKDIIEDNIELHSESSDFLPVKDEIQEYPNEQILIGYAPSVSEEAEFYIVLTKESKDAIIDFIQTQREDHENRVRYAIYKPPGPWLDLGSGAEIDAYVVKNTRPLFEIEVTSKGDLLNMPVNLMDRKADDQRDGYIELLPYRQIFENIWRKLVSRATQIMPIVQHNEAQTIPSIPVNSWYQYLYKYKTIDLSTYTEDKIDSFKEFLKRYTSDMCDQLLMNSTWDIYTNDYVNLVRYEKDTQAPVPIGYEEHQSYYNGKIILDKVINDFCWHPFWTGTAVATYTQHAKGEHLIGPKTYDEVFLASEGNNRVLIWSFTDCLSPKLILECPREVTSIGVCPLDASIIVGGCENGQIAIWHIPGKIEQVESVIVQTGAQIKYSIAMRGLMTWMRETVTSLISPSAMSSLKYSQKGRITQINWVPSYHKIDSNGRISSLPDDTSLDDLSCQCVTASEDGTIAFWDLNGYEFATDVSVNRETVQWLWIKRTHDGPVTHSVRSNYYHHVLVTIGGKIFAIWWDDFGEPLIWKKSKIRYTACSWGILRPTILILGRMDGTIEIWDLIVKSHKPSFAQSLSGRIITGIYTHELPLEPQCIGFCDFNGSLRMFTAPRVLLTYDVSDVEWLKKFIDRQVQRIREFKAWQETWREKNPEKMKKKMSEIAEMKKRLEAEERKIETFEPTIHEPTPTMIAHRKPWQFIEEARERWLSIEVKRMQRLILEKKGLRKDVLERQRAPLLRLRQEERTKKRKIREILNLQDRIFEEAVVFLFPEQERRETLLPPLPVSAIDRRLMIDEFIKETTFRKEDVFIDPEEEIIYNFLEVQAEALAKLESTPFERTFDWGKILARGKSKRRSMDIELKKLNKLKKTAK